jgi:hypothetical protein
MQEDSNNPATAEESTTTSRVARESTTTRAAREESANAQGTVVDISQSPEHQRLLQKIAQEKKDIMTFHEDTKNKGVIIAPKVITSDPNKGTACPIWWACYYVIKGLPEECVTVKDQTDQIAEIGNFWCNLCGKVVSGKSGAKPLKNHLLGKHGSLAEWVLKHGMKKTVKQKGGNSKAATSSSKNRAQASLHQSWSKVVDSDVLKMIDRQRE